MDLDAPLFLPDNGYDIGDQETEYEAGYRTTTSKAPTAAQNTSKTQLSSPNDVPTRRNFDL